MCQLLEFAKTIRISHTLFALPFALGTALLAKPPCPDWRVLLVLLACLVTARTAAMGMNRVADAALDARNPRTAGRAIPAGRLSRRAALAMSLASGAAFIALAWLFYPGNGWPGLLAPVFLAILFAYSWTKRFTFLAHWVLGLCLGLAPVGVWIALRGGVLKFGSLGNFLVGLDGHFLLVPVFIGAGVMLWTAGFDILYSLQDMEVDRRERLYSVPARFGRRGAQILAALTHAATIVALGYAVAELLHERGQSENIIQYSGLIELFPAYSHSGWLNLGGIVSILPPRGAAPYLKCPASTVAVVLIAVALLKQHVLAFRKTPEQIAAAFFPLNVTVSMIWLAGVLADLAIAWRNGMFTIFYDGP